MISKKLNDQVADVINICSIESLALDSLRYHVLNRLSISELYKFVVRVKNGETFRDIIDE